MSEVKIKAMPRASLMDDGSLVQLEFKSEDGQTFLLEFTPDDLEAWAGRATQLTNSARNHKLTNDGHLAVHTVDVVEAAAGAPAGGKVVILSLRGTNGIPLHFSMRPQKSAELRQQMQRAEQDAREQAKQARN